MSFQDECTALKCRRLGRSELHGRRHRRCECHGQRVCPGPGICERCVQLQQAWGELPPRQQDTVASALGRRPCCFPSPSSSCPEATVTEPRPQRSAGSSGIRDSHWLPADPSTTRHYPRALANHFRGHRSVKAEPSGGQSSTAWGGFPFLCCDILPSIYREAAVRWLVDEWGNNGSCSP